MLGQKFWNCRTRKNTFTSNFDRATFVCKWKTENFIDSFYSLVRSLWKYHWLQTLMCSCSKSFMENCCWTSCILSVCFLSKKKFSSRIHLIQRLRQPEDIRKRTKFPRFGSTFRYTGTYTYHQTRQLLLDRPNPDFERTLSKRLTRTLNTSQLKKLMQKKTKTFVLLCLGQREIQPRRIDSDQVCFSFDENRWKFDNESRLCNGAKILSQQEHKTFWVEFFRRNRIFWLCRFSSERIDDAETVCHRNELTWTNKESSYNDNLQCFIFVDIDSEIRRTSSMCKKTEEKRKVN